MTWRFSMVVERGKLAELARALRGSAPDLADPEPLVAPPTFAAVIGHWGSSNREQLRELGFDAGRVLHGEERYRYFGGPLREGDRLAGETALVSEERKRGRDGRTLRFATFRTELREEATDRLRVEVERVVVEVGA